MLTQFFTSINWVDVVLVLVFIRIVFSSVKTGFVAEGFKFLGVVCALFVSLHWYSYLASLLVNKTTLPLESCQFLIFVALWGLAVVVFKFVRVGLLLLFKVESAHQGFDQYAAGFVGAGRAIFTCSLLIFACLLLGHPTVHSQAKHSLGFKVCVRAAPNTYSFIFYNAVGKLFEGQQLNTDVFVVVSDHGVNPKRNHKRGS